MPLNLAQIIPVIDWNDMSINFLAQSHRTPRFIAWFQGLVNGSNAWINKNFYNYYYGDMLSNTWINSKGYTLNTTIIFSNVAGVWISTLSGINLNNNPTLNVPFWVTSTSYSVGNCVSYQLINYVCSTANSDSTFTISNWTALINPDGSTYNPWYKISPNYIGAKERCEYSSSKLIFEYALNRWFRPAGAVFNQPTSFRDGTTTYTLGSTSVLGIWYLPVSSIVITTVPVSEFTFLVGEKEASSSASGEAGSNNANITDVEIGGTDSTFKYIVWIPTSIASVLGVNYVSIISNVVNSIGILGTTFQINTY